ncbi:carboxypeptidase-like regulatory domain-containing protein [Tenacibaculum xiamenense]|uniref:carboxypeptidase-like regulatory domain-containing protein n=1 Tax=Tenacibaculum xiamenense TaxID=1261553 RepID=UPI0038942D27
MKLKHLTFGIIALLGIVSCGGDDNPTSEPVTKANIIGSVNLYDEATTQVDNSNMMIKVEGITPSISATTNSEGSFTLQEVPFGTYSISYEKQGFGTFKKFNIEHSNTGSSTILTGAPSLGQMSTTTVTGVTATANGNNIVVSVTTNPAGTNSTARYIRYFMSKNESISHENYTFHSSGITIRINPIEITLSQSDLTNAGFSSGETVYIRAYGDSFWSNEYEDPNLNRKIFPNLNSSTVNAVSFVVP